MEVLEQINEFLANKLKEAYCQIIIQARVIVDGHHIKKCYDNFAIEEVFDKAYKNVEKLFLEEWEIYKKINEDSIQFCEIVDVNGGIPQIVNKYLTQLKFFKNAKMMSIVTKKKDSYEVDRYTLLKLMSEKKK